MKTTKFPFPDILVTFNDGLEDVKEKETYEDDRPCEGCDIIGSYVIFYDEEKKSREQIGLCLGCLQKQAINISAIVED